jgi:hypothetical protein
MSDAVTDASAGTEERNGSWWRRTRERRYEWMRAYGPASSGLGGIITAIAFFWVILGQFEKNTAVQALLEMNRGPQPFISLHCLTALDTFDDDQLLQLHKRERILITDNQTVWISRCFADKEADESRFIVKANNADKNETRLTRMGAALLAERANQVVDKDQIVALLRVEGVMYRRLIFPEQHHRICHLDKSLFEKTRRIAKREKANPQDVVDWQQETGGFPQYFARFCGETWTLEPWAGRYMQF